MNKPGDRYLNATADALDERLVHYVHNRYIIGSALGS